MVSANGINLIRSFESCSLTAYDDGFGNLTIGWGHTAGVYPGQTITQEEADALLESDVVIYNNAVISYNNQYHWTQNEEDALTSFAYNLGTGSIAQVTKNGTRTKAQIAEAMLLYNKANGQVVPGLVTRRQREVALFKSSTTNPDTGESSGDGVDDIYFPRYSWYDMRIDQIMQAIGADKFYDDVSGWQKRIPIAKANGISNYTGQTWQNRDLCLLAAAGTLRRP